MSDLALLSTAGISDPKTRDFLDRLLQVWAMRESGDDAFVKRGEFDRLAGNALAQALSGGVIGGAQSSVSQALENITNLIQKSVLYRILESNVGLQDLDALRNEVASGFSEERGSRQNNDSVLASAINRIWGYIGGSTAVITEGSMAGATPSTAVATAWQSVVAAVTDPNTGNVSSAAILQETRAYASNNDSTLNALYSVRAQVSAGGQTVVGGFGLAATAGAGSAQGPSIDFGVLANKFFIAAPASGYDPATDYTVNSQFPFIVVTTPATINGVTYAPGVYMKKAVIGEASIEIANIAQHLASNFNGTFDGSGNIDTFGTTGWALDKSGQFVINDLYARGDIQASSLTTNAVVTESINGESVTVSRYADSSATVALPNLASWGATITTSAMNSKGADLIFTVIFDGTCAQDGTGEAVGDYIPVEFQISRVGSGVLFTGVILRPTIGGQVTVTYRSATSDSNSWQYSVDFRSTTLAGSAGQAYYRGLHVTSFIR